LRRGSIVAANAEVIAAAGKDHDLHNMAATIALALWRPADGMYVAGVGDRRAYLVRDRKIEQLTVDHSLAQALVEAKTITAAEARTHRFRKVLWKYLGSTEVANGPDVTLLQLLPHDRLAAR